MCPNLASQSDVSERVCEVRDPRGELSDRRFLLYSAILIVLALVSRRPDAVLQPQFWAEDGTVFYAGAYTFGWHALLFPELGYFLTLQRLIAMVSLAVPLRWAPLVMNVIALAIQAVPPLFLLTERFAVIGTRRVRWYLVCLLLAIPVAPELHATITNSHWHLALLAFMVFMAGPPTSIAWCVFDTSVVLLSGASGPFCILLLPVAVAMLWFRRNRWAGVLLALNCAGVALQAPAILLRSASARSPATLGATPMLLVRIMGGQVIIGSLLGPKFPVLHPILTQAVVVGAFVGAALALVYMLTRAPRGLRLLACFGACIAVAGLWSPQVSPDHPQWPVMLQPYAGARYWYILVLAWVWTLLWLSGRERPAVIRILGALALALVLRTDAWYWKYPRFTDFGFATYASEFEQLPNGQSIRIPVNPLGAHMVLRKH
jgi:hypothetical protein